MSPAGELLIVGGSDAGVSAALRARELDREVEISLALADAYPNFSICGLPYLLSGEVSDWRSLAHRTRSDLEAQRIALLTDTPAERIYPDRRRVLVRDPDGRRRDLRYDRLVLATGAEPLRPPLPGLELPAVFMLHTMDDALAISRHIDRYAPDEAVIVGAGYIGCEMADALTRRGLDVRVIEQVETVLGTVDPPLGQLVAAELERHGIALHLGATVAAIESDESRLMVATDTGERFAAGLVLVVVGVRPNSQLGSAAGVSTGPRGALCVDRLMRTNLPDVWAAGDCVQTHHRLLEQPTYLPLGSTAHKQGRVAGENAIGGRREFAGSLGTQVVKVFDLAIAATGLRDHAARQAGFDPVTVQTTVPDHKPYYPGACPLTVRICGDRDTGRLLGAQIVGHGGQVAKRIDTFVAALHERLSVDAISDLDLSYTPPFGAPWDPVQSAAQAWSQHITRGPVLEAA